MQAYSRGGLVFAVVEGGSSWAHNVRGARLARVVGRCGWLVERSGGVVDTLASQQTAFAAPTFGARLANSSFRLRSGGRRVSRASATLSARKKAGKSR